MGTLGPNDSEDSIDRIGRSVGSTMKVCNSFDKSNKVPEESGKHSKRTVDLDMEKLLVGLKCGKVFDNLPGRKHTQFPNIQVNMTRKLTVQKLEKWMSDQVKKSEVFYV